MILPIYRNHGIILRSGFLFNWISNLLHANETVQIQ